MTHIIYAVTVMIFASHCSINAAEKQPKASSISQQEQDKRDSDAAEYRRRVAALGGKLLHLDDEETPTTEKNKPKITTDKPATKTDVRARL